MESSLERLDEGKSEKERRVAQLLKHSLTREGGGEDGEHI